MNISLSAFRMLADRRLNGAIPGFGWSVYQGLVCPNCEAHDLHVSYAYARGFACRHCGYTDPDYTWPPERQRQDGPFLNPVYERTRRNLFAPRAKK